MPLSAGARLGAYEIVETIGVGGMGEVYRARDEALGRDVAIKVLPDDFAHDDERRARFQREARLLASVNHPGIATVHGLEQQNGVHFLVMELLEGETLETRIAKGALPPEVALPLFAKLASALEAAHRKGVIHRDLKPANIQLLPDGSVKVMDFGLAKDVSAEPHTDTELSRSPTRTKDTALGTIMGTAPYMSPEQARGQPLDARTDVWSFGCVFFEALTGRRAFSGTTLTDLLAAIVTREPDWSALPRDLPWRARDVLRRSLRKDAARRVPDIGAVRLDLEDAADEQPRSEAVQGRSRLSWLVAGAAAVAIASAFFFTRGEAEPVGVTRFTITLPPGRTMPTMSAPHIAWSHDGRELVYAGIEEGERRLYLRTLDDVVDTRIEGSDGAMFVFFSSDGRELVFNTDVSVGPLYKISATGGRPAALAENVLLGAAWNAQEIVYAGTDSLWRVPANGGAPEKLPGLEEAEFVAWPEFLPGGETLLYSGLVDNEMSLYAYRMRSGESRKVLPSAMDVSFLEPGYLVFARVDTPGVFAIRFDPERLELTGPQIQLREPFAASVNGIISLAVSRSGNLAYRSTSEALQLVWVDRSGQSTPVVEGSRLYNRPRLSPDGTRVAVAISDRDRGRAIWLLDAGTGSFARLTFGDGDATAPAWSPDGQRVAFAATRGVRSWQTYIRRADGTGDEELMVDRENTFPLSFSPDARSLAVLHPGGTLGLLRLDGDSTVEELPMAGQQFSGVFSPKGRFLAYASNETGNWEIYVKPFPSLDGKWQISVGGGTEPVWSRDGTELFYRNGTKLMAVPTSTSQVFSYGKASVLFDGPYKRDHVDQIANYDVSPDGERFLMIEEDPEVPTEITVVLNWVEELERLAKPD